jgi:hypothetical protein
MKMHRPLNTCAAMAALLVAAAADEVRSPVPAETGFDPARLSGLAGTRGFVPYAGNPVLKPGGAGQWDAGALGSMSVVRVGETYHMYYEAWGVRSEKQWSHDDAQGCDIRAALSRGRLEAVAGADCSDSRRSF